MSPSRSGPGPEAPVYEIRVDGHLDDHWSSWLECLSINRDDDGTTRAMVGIADQAQLHGALTRLRDAGAMLLSFARVESRPEHPPALGGVLQTERLSLRAASAADAEATWAFRRLPAVQEWLTGTPATLDEYRSFFAEPSRLATTVIVELRHGGAVIGDFMLRVEDSWAQLDVAERARKTRAELGWVLDPAHSGHGYAAEAVRELIRHCFEELHVRRIVANCFLANTASWRLMERIGMRREAHAVRESLHRSGQWMDTVSYALLADE